MTDRADITSLLSDMRTMRSQMMRPNPIGDELHVQRPNQIGEVKETGFSDTLSKAINHVADIQNEASAMQKSYLRGEEMFDITQVMIQSQKASVAFQALTQVRNKVVQAYEEIMKMPV